MKKSPLDKQLRSAIDNLFDVLDKRVMAQDHVSKSLLVVDMESGKMACSICEDDEFEVLIANILCSLFSGFEWDPYETAEFMSFLTFAVMAQMQHEYGMLDSSDQDTIIENTSDDSKVESKQKREYPDYLRPI